MSAKWRPYVQATQVPDVELGVLRVVPGGALHTSIVYQPQTFLVTEPLKPPDVSHESCLG